MTPLELFVGRGEEIAAFGKLLETGSARWAMSVSGLSGTGKSLLIDWLRENACAGVRTAKVQLSPSTTPADFLHLVAMDLDPAFEAELGARLAALEQGNPLVHVEAPSMVMEGRLGGKISESSQTSTTNVQVTGAAVVEALDRETRRLDALIDVLKPLGSDRWVIFVDETEHLEGRAFGSFLMERLVPRLHGRFPGFRLYLSGQSMPRRAGFALHEVQHFDLQPFGEGEVGALLERAGIGGTDERARLFRLTSGHPLLLGMLIQDADLLGNGFDAAGDGAGALPAKLDEAAVTSWIYRRILDRLPEEARPIAADLALFDWFDLSILRQSFEAEISPQTFQGLVRRSFVKAIGPGQWRCHDILRRHLAEERRQTDMQSVAEICGRAFDAFDDQMRLRAEREGEPYFAGRLDYVRGGLASASGFSAKRALDFISAEFCAAAVAQGNDYLFALAQMMATEGVPKPVRDLGGEARRFLERLNAEKFDRATAAFAQRMAEAAAALGQDDARSTFRGVALAVARQCGDWQTALAIAHARAEETPDVDNRLILARTLAESGAAEQAREVLDAVRADCGDTPDVLTAFGDYSHMTGESDAAQGYWADAIAAAPHGAEMARLQLARTLYLADRDEEALAMVEKLLEIQPGLKEAQRLRMEIMGWLGRFRSISVDEDQIADIYRELQDNFAEIAGGEAGGEILTAMAEDPDRVPVPVLLGFGELVAARGDEATLRRIHEAVVARAPESQDLVDLQWQVLLLVTGRAVEAVEATEDLLDRRPDLSGAYFLLSRMLRVLDRRDEARDVLEKLAERFPSLQDRADVEVASSFVEVADFAGALGHLEGRAAEGALGPEGQVLRATLLAGRGKPAEAAAALETVIFTAGRDELSMAGMIAARKQYGLLCLLIDHPEKTRATAEGLLELFAGIPAASVAAVELFAGLGDAAAVRRVVAAAGDAPPPLVRSAVVSALGTLEFRKQDGDAKALLEAVRREPERMELSMAAMLSMMQMPTQEGVGWIAQLHEVAPGAMEEIQRISVEVMVADPATREVAMQMRLNANMPPVMRAGLTAILALNGFLPLDEARRDLKLIGEEVPEAATLVRMNELRLLLDLGRTEDAAPLVAPYLEPDGMVEPAVPLVARFLDATGDREGAADYLERAAEAYPAARRGLQELRVDLLIAHDAGRALESLEVMEAEAPLSLGLAISRANALGELDRHDEAVGTLEQALRDATEDAGSGADGRAAALRVLGSQRLMAKDSAGAIAAYREALELQPRRAGALAGLSAALEQAGEAREAYARLRDAVALEPARLPAVEDRLQRLRAALAEEAAAS